MLKFVKHLLAYSAVLLAIMISIFCFNWYQSTKNIHTITAETMVIGDSRMMTGIDPKCIENCINFAQNTESYFISYFKLKYLINHSSGLKNIVVGFSYPSFSAYMDRVFQNDIATSDVLKRIYPIIALRDFGNIPVDHNLYNLVVFRNMFVYPHFSQTPFLGSFTPLKPEKLKSNPNSTINRHYYDDNHVDIGISATNRHYLDSILQLAKSNNIHVVLVNLPLHQDYVKQIPKKFITYFEKVKLAIEGKNVTILDFGKELVPNEYFKDYVHLSSIGAREMTIRVQQKLNVLTLK